MLVYRDATVLDPIGSHPAITSSYTYQYSLEYYTADPCVDNWSHQCSVGMYWGDINDQDYLDFYNSRFVGFAWTQVGTPDNALEKHFFHATEGLGVYDTTKMPCQNRLGSNGNGCANDAAWDENNAISGREYRTDSFNPWNGTTWPLMRQVFANYQVTCPPSGVGASPPSTTYGNWDSHLVGELDGSNPLAVCDVQLQATTTSTANGAANPNSTNAPQLVEQYTYVGLSLRGVK